MRSCPSLQAGRVSRSVHDRRAHPAWLLDHRRQTVLAVEHGPTLWVIAGGVGLTLRGRDHQLAAPMVKRRWYELRIIAEDGRVWLRQTALQRSWGVTDSGEAEFPGSLDRLTRLSLAPRRARATTRAATSLTGGSRIPRSLPVRGVRRHRWSRTMQIVSPGGGFLTGDPQRAHPRPRPARAPRHPAEPPNASGSWIALEWGRDELGLPAPALFRDPFP